MSVDTSKLITTERLSHYHSMLDSSIIQPLQQAVAHKASTAEIDEAVFGIPQVSIIVTDDTLDDFKSKVKDGTYDADFIARADVSSVTNMSAMFFDCSSLTALDLSNWDASSATGMRNMFSNCSNLTTLDLSGWDVSSVTDMRSMFGNCTSLLSLKLSGWNIPSGTRIDYLFYNCPNLTSLLIGGVINTNLDLSYTKLTPQTAEAFFTGLSAKTTENTVTITMPSTAQGADISIATAKGYTIVGIS